MKFEEFWEIYMNGRISENYAAVKEVFGKEVNEEILEEYEVAEVLFDFLGESQEKRAYENIVEFVGILKDSNVELYGETFSYYNDFLTDYYCYHDNRQALESVLPDFINYFNKDYDISSKSMKKLLYYGHTDLVERLIGQVYDKVKNMADLLPGTEYSLAMIKFRIELEKVYAGYGKNKQFDWDAFKSTMPKFDFEPNSELIALCERGFQENPKELASSMNLNVKKDLSMNLGLLEQCFVKKMREKGISFPVSSAIWGGLCDYWEKYNARRKGKAYFKLKESDFKAYLRSQIGMIMDYRFYAVLQLWGSCHVYDFLKEVELIAENEYENTKQTIKKFKKALIQENLVALWGYTFVHKWGISEMESEEERAEEQAVFRKYYKSKYKDVKDEIKDGFFNDVKAMKMVENLLGDPLLKGLFSGNPAQEEPVPQINPVEKNSPEVNPVRKNTPKIGRNEKISVKYSDGTIKRDVKYKRVKNDIDNGDCEIIKTP